jgi:hypothetical protein
LFLRNNSKKERRIRDMGKIKERINALLEAVKDDPDQLSLVKNMVDSCSHYVDTVVSMENAINVARFKISDPSEYREYVQQLDKSRRIAHNALISSVHIVDRLCKINKVELIYGGDEDRLAIAEFAKQVVDEFFEERKK